MGSGRGDRNQLTEKRFAEVVELLLQWGPVVVTGISRAGAIPGEALAGASMGSGRGDRNQLVWLRELRCGEHSLQWGPVVVTGIRSIAECQRQLN